MKRILCLVIALVLLFCCAGCGNKEENNASSQLPAEPSQSEKEAAAGKIPEMDFALGADPDEIVAFYEKQAEENRKSDETDEFARDNFFYAQSGKETGYIATGAHTYYYMKSTKSKGVSFIASQDIAYGFFVGETTKQEVENAFAYSDGETLLATEEDQFFLLSPIENCLILRYRFDNIQLDFYFSENLLLAASLTDTENWTR